jgi:hypothetical protein
MKLNDTIMTYDVAEACRTSPAHSKSLAPMASAISSRVNREIQFPAWNGVGTSPIFNRSWCEK